MGRERLIGLAVIVSLLVTAGCGKSSTSPTGASGVVAISNLRVTPVSPHGLAFTADFTDPTGSIPGGTCNAATNLGELSIPILDLLNGAAATSQSGALQCQIGYNPAFSGAAVSGTFSVTDQNGNLSNALSFSAVVP